MRISAEPVSEIDDMSTTRLGRAVPASTPPAPNRISFRSSVVETMVKTVAQCAIAVLSVTTSAPIWASGSALEAVRFQTERPWPAFTRRAAMASPMRPSPIQPMSCDALSIVMKPRPVVLRCPLLAVCEGMSLLSMSLGHALKAALCLLLVVGLGSCGGNLPNSAISRHLAGRYAGALSAGTAVPTVIRDRGIHVPDPTSAVPLLEQLRDALAKSDPGGAYAGITYDLTYGNELRSDWLVQSPNRWGRKATDFAFYPLSKPLPACSSDADCHGGTCSATLVGAKGLFRPFGRAGAAGARPDRQRTTDGSTSRCCSRRPTRASSVRCTTRSKRWRGAAGRSRFGSSSASIRRTMSTCRPSTRC